jgi:hypothetical protein
MRGVKISHTKRKSLITSPRWNLQRQQNKFRSNVSRESHKNTERALRAVAATYLDFHASESDPGLFLFHSCHFTTACITKEKERDRSRGS